MALEASELILNDDGSIYHLHLHPEQVAPLVLTVGDPDRVARVSRHFDQVEHRVQKREFVTHTGRIGSTALTVISTGIGTDNVDIVLNELDALVNIDLTTRTVRSDLRSLDIVRIGTSGTVQASIGVDSLLASHYGLGLDSMVNFYATAPTEQERAFAETFARAMGHPALVPYFFEGSAELYDRFGTDFLPGVTASCAGFYAPQGRIVRARPRVTDWVDRLAGFEHDGLRITNLEMETAALIGLGRVLGHRVTAVNAILANRATGAFSTDPAAVVDRAIERTLDVLVG